MMYIPANAILEIEEFIPLLQPDIEAHHPDGHNGFTLAVVDVVFAALYEHYRA